MRLFVILLLSFAAVVAAPKPSPVATTSCPFLVTGCARSGTTYISELLKLAGLRVGHEELGPDGCVAWHGAVDLNYHAHLFNFPKGKIEFGTILHIVRNPLKVIDSIYSRTLSPNNMSWNHAWRYIMACCPDIKRNDPLAVKCAKYWYYWNVEAEKRAIMTFRIEDFDERLDEFSALIGWQIDRQLLHMIPKNVNHYPFTTDFRSSWSYLEKVLEPQFFNNLQELASMYGYPIED